ncbi:UvrD-helicase domain-containing protein [Candidatus Berkelbacteria bacterium]|nr:UvrD-helicase domain-containing protein [Candidatus Berkelbacteria bacterium]
MKSNGYPLPNAMSNRGVSIATLQTSSSSILDELNPMQREAAACTLGPVLILAGAGSGKTKTLTHRIAYLVEQGVKPHNILAVTFTNKAAGEMRERLAKLMLNVQAPMFRQTPTTNDQNLNRYPNHFPWLGTFHSICVRILRRDVGALGYRPDFTIYDSGDSLTLVKRILTELGYDPKSTNPQTVRNFISGAKNELLSSSQYAIQADGYFMEIVAKVYKRYQTALKTANALDFDDLLMLTVELFEKNPAILTDYQNLFQHVLIDEYQDTNLAQYRFVKFLATHGNICVVGDDYQAIYGWRGANFRNILNFESDYPNTTIIKLEQNYRSTQTILDAADAVIKNNYQRTEKKLWTENGQGAPVTLYEALDGIDETDFVATEITSLRREFSSLNNFAVLYRTNAQSRLLEETFLRREVPYRLVGAVQFYERKEIKDMLAYLRAVANPNDLIAFERASGAPTRGIGKKALEVIRSEGLTVTAEKNLKVKNFVILVKSFRSYASAHSVRDLIEQIAVTSGYRDFLLDGSVEGESRWENVKELKSVAESYTTLQEFLEATSLISDVDNYDPTHEAVTLMTLHNAKGLEFPVVFIVGVEEGIFPHARALSDPAQMEEERRLCYVGMTRAKQRLYLLCANSRLLYGSIQANPSSRFLSEIPAHLKEKL